MQPLTPAPPLKDAVTGTSLARPSDLHSAMFAALKVRKHADASPQATVCVHSPPAFS